MAKDLLDTLIERHFAQVNACAREHVHARHPREIFGIPLFADATMPPGSWKLVGGRPHADQPEPGGDR